MLEIGKIHGKHVLEKEVHNFITCLYDYILVSVEAQTDEVIVFVVMSFRVVVDIR